MSKHAPGPYHIEHTGNECHEEGMAYSILTETDAVAEVYFEHMDGREGNEYANARLIAAAPELLEALKGRMECRCGQSGGPEVAPGESCEHWTKAKATIAKAEGGEA